MKVLYCKENWEIQAVPRTQLLAINEVDYKIQAETAIIIVKTHGLIETKKYDQLLISPWGLLQNGPFLTGNATHIFRGMFAVLLLFTFVGCFVADKVFTFGNILWFANVIWMGYWSWGDESLLFRIPWGVRKKTKHFIKMRRLL